MSQPSTVAVARPAVRTGVLLPAILAFLFGSLLLAGAGFAQMDVLHNAAHDVRHSNGFPCH
ncbi:MAG: CbtB domain-containing protein [Geminicoccaceae bacterium]